MQSLSFSIHRLQLLIKRELRQHYKAFLYMTGSVVGVISMQVIFGEILDNHRNFNGFNTISLVSSLFIGAIIWSSLSFSEFQNNSTKQQYLSLPASSFEKLSSKWILNSIFIPLAYFICFIAYSYILTFGINLFLQEKLVLPDYSFHRIIQMILILFLAQSLMYAGSVIMPKFTLIKVASVLFSFIIVLSIFIGLIARIVFHEYADGMSIKLHGSFNIKPQFFEFMEHYAVQNILLAACTLFFMILAYFKLKEKEL